MRYFGIKVPLSFRWQSLAKMGTQTKVPKLPDDVDGH